jgi:hypothetical protein
MKGKKITFSEEELKALWCMVDFCHVKKSEFLRHCEKMFGFGDWWIIESLDSVEMKVHMGLTRGKNGG